MARPTHKQFTAAAKTPRSRREAVDPVKAYEIFKAAPDDVPFPPEIAAPILQKSIPALEKLRSVGGGPKFIKIGRNVFYPAGALREYLRGLEQFSVTQ